MSKHCIFTILNPDEPNVKTCLGRSGKIGDGPDDGCGNNMKSTLPPEKCHAVCGAKKNGAKPFVILPRKVILPGRTPGKQLEVERSPAKRQCKGGACRPREPEWFIRFGDLAEWILSVVFWWIPADDRPRRWTRFRNRVFGSRFVRKYLGVRLTLAAPCACKQRQLRWNSYGGLFLPVWLRWAFPKPPSPPDPVEPAEPEQAPQSSKVRVTCDCPPGVPKSGGVAVGGGAPP